MICVIALMRVNSKKKKKQDQAISYIAFSKMLWRENKTIINLRDTICNSERANS